MLTIVVIMIFFMFLSATVFHVILMNKAPELYGDMGVSIRTMIDMLVANYTYHEIEGFEYLYAIMVIIQVLVSAVIFLNLLIAIISSVYNSMQ